MKRQTEKCCHVRLLSLRGNLSKQTWLFGCHVMVKWSSLSRSTSTRAESLNLISLPLVKPKKSVLLSCYIGFLALPGHLLSDTFFSLFKHFTNPLAASTTRVPWHGAAGRFVAYLMGLLWYPFLRIDTRFIETRDCLFGLNSTLLLWIFHVPVILGGQSWVSPTG